MSLEEASMSPLLLQGCIHLQEAGGQEGLEKEQLDPELTGGGSQSAIAWTGIAYRAKQKFSLPRWVQRDGTAKLAGAKSHSHMNEKENKMDRAVQFLSS